MPLCQHFGVCGGCKTQDKPYKEQLIAKKTLIQELALKHLITAPIKPINFTHEWFYRNKMEFTFSPEPEGLVLGMHSQLKRYSIFDMQECLIFSSDATAILSAIREFAKSRGYSGYNKFKYTGFLRHLIVRETKHTKELMIGLVATSALNFDRQGFIQTLTNLKLSTQLKSVYLITNNSKSDAVVFEKKELLLGNPYLTENLGSFQFKIGIDTFFQVNPLCVELLYQKILQAGQLTGRERVLDLCCGCGTIGIFLSPQAKFVWGVELVPEIVETAWENARLNKITNISFFTQDAKNFLYEQGLFHQNTDILVINPPRSGLPRQVIQGVLRLKPKTILYSSCNPETLFSDISSMANEYTIESLEPFDLFPHTFHVECLAVLRKIC
jgi:23S rRNA (uracil-5-)-methyltransferase RumA